MPVIWWVKSCLSSHDFTRYQHCTKKTVHCTYLSKITAKRVRGSIGVESRPLSEIGGIVTVMALNCVLDRGAVGCAVEKWS